MQIQDVTVKSKDGNTQTFIGVGEKTMKVIAPGLPVMLEFMSALGTSMGAVVLEPGMIFTHTNTQAIVEPSNIKVEELQS